jgi:lipoprotein-anchoring transpeptidase ErfK/SrfK
MTTMFKPIRLLLAFALLGACANATAAEPSIVTPSTITTTTIAATTTTTIPVDYYEGFATSTLPEDTSLVGMARGDLVVYQEPDSPEIVTTLPGTTILGTVTVVTVVEGPVDGWARVMLPIRPNGSEGWIKTDQVDLFIVEGRLVVDLSEKQLTYYKGGKEILTAVVAIGTKRNPTPVGKFFITDNVTMSSPTSPWGPHAFGLSARSDTITEYNGGDGIIGIHGTNRPGSIGSAASLGCVRVPNDVITKLHDLIAIGTPVEIRA